MNSLKSFLLGSISVLVVIVGVGFLLPSKYKIKECVFIQESPQRVFEQINTLPHWKQWAFVGYEELPEVTFMGPVDGTGAIYVWQDARGGGRMEIVSSSAPSNVQLKLTTQGGSYTSYLYFIIEPQNGGALVRWNEEGDVGMNIQARFLLLVGTLEAAIANNSQLGLQGLKARCEQMNR